MRYRQPAGRPAGSAARRPRRTAGWLLGVMALATGCATQGGSSATVAPVPPAATTPVTTPAPEPVAPEPSITAAPPASAVPPSTAPTSTLPPTTAPEVHDPECVAQVSPGDGLLTVVGRFDHEMLDVDTIMAENGLESNVIVPGQLLDVCVDNGVNDIDGTPRRAPNAALVERDEIAEQQEHLNRLFVPLGMRELLVDGRSGPATGQRLCAFRVAIGVPVSTDPMPADSDEMTLLRAIEQLPVPPDAATGSDRWILIEQTCQVMFVGSGDGHLEFVFATSTGDADHPTRDQDRSRVFKFNPAIDNGGWHDSTEYPAPEDNPLNGNMYKPLYFDAGQAIHGANNVPNFPASKGCVRLQVHEQDQLLAWLGLADRTDVTWGADQIDVTVDVQGRWIPAAT